MPANGKAISRAFGRCTQGLALFCIVFATGAMALAQDKVVQDRRPIPTEISPELLILADKVVEQQWPATLSLVNVPSDLKQVEPGQCVRFEVIATGDDRDELLASSKISLEFSLAGNTQVFRAEPPEVLKQVKPEGGDLVTRALAAGGIKNPFLSVAGIAASRAKWCAPLDTQDGTATIRATVKTADGKTVALKPRNINVMTFRSSRKNAPFKDMDTFGSWLENYYEAPDLSPYVTNC